MNHLIFDICPICKKQLAKRVRRDYTTYDCCAYVCIVYHIDYVGDGSNMIDETIYYSDGTSTHFTGTKTFVQRHYRSKKQSVVIDGRLNYQINLDLFLENYKLL